MTWMSQTYESQRLQISDIKRIIFEIGLRHLNDAKHYIQELRKSSGSLKTLSLKTLKTP